MFNSKTAHAPTHNNLSHSSHPTIKPTPNNLVLPFTIQHVANLNLVIIPTRTRRLLRAILLLVIIIVNHEGIQL